MAKNYLIGVDLGGTKILAAVYDDRFKLLAAVKAKTKPQKAEKYFLKTIRGCMENALKEASVDRSRVLAIGIGCPGIIDERTGTVIESANIRFLKHYPLAQRVSRMFQRPVYISNDVKTGLYGEHQLGAAKGCRHVIGIFIGTGIGGALILNNELYKGTSGGAGEIGHIFVDPFGPRCGCGQRGCFEALASRLAIATEAAGLTARQKAPHLFHLAGTDVAAMKSGALAKSIKAGDRAIQDLIRQKAQLVGTVMASLVNLLNPEMIVLGGGLVEAIPGLILREAERTMRARAMGPLARKVRVRVAKFGDYSITTGAAKRAWDMTELKRGKKLIYKERRRTR